MTSLSTQNQLRNTLENKVTAYFEKGDIIINGPNKWDIQVIDNRFYKAFRDQFTIGLMESYAEGWIEIEDFEELFYRLFRNRLYFDYKPSIKLIGRYLLHRYLPMNLLRQMFIADKHYNLPEQLFMSFLGESKAYTCGYYFNRNSNCDFNPLDPESLDRAQFAKLDLVLDKLKLKSGDTLLDIGCGWGSMAHHAAATRGINVVGITVASAQIEYAKKWCAGLPVQVNLQSYTDPIINYFNPGKPFDSVSSLGMIEHVGSKMLPLFFKRAREVTKVDGNLVVQSISSPYPMDLSDPYTDKYIFPDSNCPTPGQISTAAEKFGWKKQDEHLFVDRHGVSYYYHTCMAWDKKLKENWPDTRQYITHMDPDKFFRLWGPCFQIFAGMFRAGTYPQLRQYTFNGLACPQLPIVR